MSLLLVDISGSAQRVRSTNKQVISGARRIFIKASVHMAHVLINLLDLYFHETICLNFI